MAEIKSVVGLLSKLLNNYFNSNLKAEHFRLAKYDKNEEDVVSFICDPQKQILIINFLN